MTPVHIKLILHHYSQNISLQKHTQNIYYIRTHIYYITLVHKKHYITLANKKLYITLAHTKYYITLVHLKHLLYQHTKKYILHQ